MHQGKRYTESRFGSGRGPNILLRVIISISIAIIISACFIMFGAYLGEKVPEDNKTETSREEHTSATTDFMFKNIEAKRVCSVSALPMFGENKPSTVYLNVSDGEGKLNCMTSINSLIYGDAVMSELRPIEALLYEAKQKAENVSVRFTPLRSDTSDELAGNINAAIAGVLSEYEIDEIVLLLDCTSPDAAREIREGAQGRVKVGGVLNPDMLENEELIREYYSALDFLVLDLSALDMFDSEESDAEVAAPSDAGEASSGAHEMPESVESVMRENSLNLIKYSVRLRVTCKTEKELSEFLGYITSFGFCGFEVEN